MPKGGCIMTEFKRDFFKNDPQVMGKLHQHLVKIHKVAPHTEKVLIENRHVEDFCEESRHFVILDGTPQIYLHYDVATWFKKPNGVQAVIDSIGVYDDFMEYETARMKGLHSGRSANIPNIN